MGSIPLLSTISHCMGNQGAPLGNLKAARQVTALHVQYRITFRPNHLTGEQPLVATLLVPILSGPRHARAHAGPLSCRSAMQRRGHQEPTGVLHGAGGPVPQLRSRERYLR